MKKAETLKEWYDKYRYWAGNKYFYNGDLKDWYLCKKENNWNACQRIALYQVPIRADKGWPEKREEELQKAIEDPDYDMHTMDNYVDKCCSDLWYVESLGYYASLFPLRKIKTNNPFEELKDSYARDFMGAYKRFFDFTSMMHPDETAEQTAERIKKLVEEDKIRLGRELIFKTRDEDK